MSIIFSVDLHCVIFSASSSMIDATPMCICPCNLTSTTSQSTSLLHHSTSGAIITSRTSDQSPPSSYILTTTATNTTSASVSLSSSVCYCPCNTTSSTSYMLRKYAYRKRLARSQFAAFPNLCQRYPRIL